MLGSAREGVESVVAGVVGFDEREYEGEDMWFLLLMRHSRGFAVGGYAVIWTRHYGTDRLQAANTVA